MEEWTQHMGKREVIKTKEEPCWDGVKLGVLMRANAFKNVLIYMCMQGHAHECVCVYLGVCVYTYAYGTHVQIPRF
jgi:hypothetical protein